MQFYLLCPVAVFGMAPPHNGFFFLFVYFFFFFFFLNKTIIFLQLKIEIDVKFANDTQYI